MPFESHVGRKAKTPLINISTKTNSSDFSYEKNLNRYLDEETVTPNELPPEVTVRNSDIAKFGIRDERKTKLLSQNTEPYHRIHTNSEG